MAQPTLEKMAQTRATLLTLLADVSEEQMDQPHEEGWTVRETLTHLVNAEEDHCRIIALLARGDGHRLPGAGFDLDTHNAERLAARGHLSKQALLDALAAQRARTEALFGSLSAEQMAIVGRHPAIGETTVAKIFRIIGLHERAHTQEIADALGGAGV